MEDDFSTASGIPIKAAHTPEDCRNIDYGTQIGMPGLYPFTRGVRSDMYRSRLWTMRQYSGYATPEESNRRFHYLLEQGQTGLSIAFDLPTQTGYDSDHSLAVGEVGKVGVPIDSLIDMEGLLKGIPLDRVTTSMTINSTAPILLALYLSVAKKQGISFDKIRGTIQNDILKEYIARGTYIYPPKPSMRLVTDIFKYCSRHVPNWNTISISGYHMREAGATAIQELAFTFSNAIEYVKTAVQSGLDVDQFASRLSFFFAASTDLFEEIAKYRAARRIWANIMKTNFKAKDPKSMMLRFHAQTAGVTLTAQQVENNVVRTTIQALAAVLGGTQSLHVNSKDEALSLPSEASAELSLRTQQIIAHESGVINTVDPLAGSYYIEYLTNQLYEESNALINQVESLGGAIACIDNGFQSVQIHESAYALQKSIENQSQIVIGVNKYQKNEKPYSQSTAFRSSTAEKQIAKLRDIRATRDNWKVENSLHRLKTVAMSEDNIMEPIIDCVELYATIGEISDALRSVFGEHQEYITI